jgi:succinate dehydrogenase / fumarate reductase cytochrome b subunit
MSATNVPDGSRGSFLQARLASLLAIAPLGVWTVMHLWDNLSVYRGGEEWQRDVTGHQHPIALGVTSLVVLLPLLLHTLWGFGRLWTTRPNNASYRSFENLKYILQRLSALGVAGFLGAHLWLAFLHPRLVEHHAEAFSELSGEMRHAPATLVVYLLGTLGVSYHLGNGLFGFAWSWGLAASRRTLRGFQTASILLFVVLLAMSWGAIFGLWSAGA